MKIFYLILNITAAFLALNAYRIIKTRGKAVKPRSEHGITEKLQLLAKRYGITQKSDVILYTFMPFAGVASGAVMLAAGRISSAVALFLAPAAVVFFMLAARRKKAASVFQKNAYKLYKYILNQTSAGVRPGDAMKRMFDVVSEKKLRRNLMEACAK